MNKTAAHSVNLVFLAAILMFEGTAGATVLYSNSLDNGIGWGVNASSDDTAVTFGYYYGVDGIPEAPNPVFDNSPIIAGNTGVKVEANIDFPPGPEFLSLFPVGEHFTGNYQLRFDAWTNYNANAPNGSTEFLGGGIGYNGIASEATSGAQVIASRDAGSGRDWRTLLEGFILPDFEMAAGTSDANGAIPYYSDFLPSVQSPPEQGFPSASVPGSPSFQWITFEIAHLDGVVEITIEKQDGSRLPIATINSSDYFFTTDGNISLLYSDNFSSVADSPELSFGLFDNVVVTALPPAGDFDSDFDVDFQDYLVWESTYGSTTSLDADANRDGVVDAADYTIWSDRFDSQFSMLQVPEPPTTILFCAMCVLFANISWHRARRPICDL